MPVEKHTDYMYGLIGRVLKEIGPRASCSDAEKKLGRLFADEIRLTCDRIETEPFTCSPGAALGMLPFLAFSYALGLLFYYFFPPVTLAIGVICTVLFFFELVRLKEFLDPLFPKGEGENVAGVVHPRGEVRKSVIFSAHLDSAHEFTLWYWFKNLSIPIMVLDVIGFLFLIGAGLARSVENSWGIPHGIYGTLGIVCIALAPLVFLLFFFTSGDVVPGAMDDMAGVSVLAGLVKHLDEGRNGNGFFPENTRVVLLGMSSEEAGLRGAKRYVERHKEELKDIPTYGIFLDGIYDEQYLSVTRREVFTGARHDPYLVGLAEEEARKNDLEIRTVTIPIGATDAAVFSRNGISAVHLGCQDTSRLVPNYHTRLDTIENVRPESLAASMTVCIGMLERMDKEPD